jgi:hypothetical protein
MPQSQPSAGLCGSVAYAAGKRESLFEQRERQLLLTHTIVAPGQGNDRGQLELDVFRLPAYALKQIHQQSVMPPRFQAVLDRQEHLGSRAVIVSRAAKFEFCKTGC